MDILTKASEKLAEMAISLPKPAMPLGSYVPAVRTGNLIMTSGQLPMSDGKLTVAGRVGDDISLEDAQQAAKLAVINALAAAAHLAGGVDNITQIVRVNVFVASTIDFINQAQVANGASDLLGEIFGAAGRHTRCAIGAAILPLNSPVEVDITVQL